MDAESSIKRKKRKTRKCLDEIRNRSRGIYLKPSLVDNRDSRFDSSSNKPVSNESKVSSNMTNSRLTLAMFPKAVRSETITRPILSEIKKVPVLPNILKSKISLIDSSNTKSVSLLDKVDNDDAQEEPSHASHVHNITISSASSSEPFILLENKSETDHTDGSKSVHSIPTLSSASSQSPQVTYQNIFYEQLMSEIPFHLKKYTPNLIGRDPMKNNIAFIRKCHAETCQREYERSVTPSINFRNKANGNLDTATETIVQNPKDYIRLAWQHGAAVQPPRTAPASPRDPPSLAGSPPDPPSPAGSPPASPLPPASPPTPSIINDTPEYAFYPHRLN